jgi:fatty-acyl-CoA synthase
MGLLLKHLWDRPLAWAPEQVIVYRDLKTLTYRELFQRIHRLANLLGRLGVGAGDRVGVLDHDSHRYLELYFAVPMVGAVLHTINAGLSLDQLAYTMAHAEDKVLFLHEDFAATVDRLKPRLGCIQRQVLLSDHGNRGDNAPGYFGEYEALLAESPPEFDFPEFDENTVATLFYTTGTTGDPKGVFFTHRQIVLHTLVVGLTMAVNRAPVDMHAQDVYLPLTPMFHVHSWGFPYLATCLGLKQVYQGRPQPHMLASLMAKHRPTLSHGVPTILRNLLHNPAFRDLDLSGLKLLIGGSALTEDLVRAAEQRGVRVMAGYGMSETCPVVTAAHLRPSLLNEPAETRVQITTRAGFPAPLVRVKIVDEGGRALPPGRTHTGEILLRSPWLTPGYFKSPDQSRELWRDGWLHTGDVGYLDADGYVRITDRFKDVIKIGGEWISSLELENALCQHPAVAEAAVVALPDSKWGECPHADVVLRAGFPQPVKASELLAHLRQFVDRGAIHKRALLTRIRFVAALPKTSVGKLDKKTLRTHMAEEEGTAR